MKGFLFVIILVFVILSAACGHADLIRERDSLLTALLITQRWEKEHRKERDFCRDRVRAICAAYENHIFSPAAIRKPEWDRKKWREEYREYCFRGQGFRAPEGGKR